MPLKRIAKFLIITITVLVCVLIGAYCYFFYSYMPNHFQKKILPDLMKDAGISGFSGKVKSAGAFGANLGELCIGDPENPTLKVRSVIIKYHFQNIFMPRTPDITSLEFSGVELICRIRGKRFEINNVDIEKFVEQLMKRFSGKHKKAIGFWGKTKLKVTDGLMHLDWNGTRLLLPFELLFNPEKQNWEIFTAELKFTWREHPVKAELLVDLNKQTTEIKFNARVEMRRLLDLMKRSKQWAALSELKLAGLADLRGDIRFGFSSGEIQKLMISGTSKSCEIHYGALSLYNKRRPSGLKIPLTISVSSDGDDYTWKLRNGLVKKPIAVFARELSCFVSRNKRKALRFGGELELDLAKLKLFRYYAIKNESGTNPVRKISGRFNRITKNWQLETVESGGYARKTPIKSLITCGETKIFAEISELGFSGRGCGRNGKLAVKMQVKKLSATGYKNAFFCDNLELYSNFQLVPSSGGKMRIKKNHFKFVVPEFFCSSLERQIKINDLTISGSNSFDGFKMNGFELTADTGIVKIKQNNNLLTGKNNLLTLDGIFQKSKKTWELAINSRSAEISGKYNKNDFNLRNAQSKIFLSLPDPLFKWAGTRSCNVRLKCDGGSYGNEAEKLKFSGFKLGTALTFDAGRRLLEETFSGKIDNVEAKYQDFNTVVANLELVGKFDRAGKKSGKKTVPAFLSRLEAKSIRVQRNDIKYSAKSVQLNLAGETFAELMMPKSFQAGFVLPALSISRGEDKIQIINTSLKADSIFANENNGYDWRRSLKNINIELALDKISGIWEKINILSKKTLINASAKIGFKNSAVRLKNLNFGLRGVKTVAYTKSWKLASRKFSLNSTGKGTVDSKLTLKPNLRLNNFYVSSRSVSLHIPEAVITADLTDGKVSGLIFWDNAAFSKNNSDLQGGRISLRLPFGAGAAEGKLTIDKVKLRNQNMGRIDAKLKIKDDDLLIKASHFSNFFPDASAFFSGRVKLSASPVWEGDFTVPEFEVKNLRSTSLVFPGLGLGFTGRVAMEGSLQGDLNSCKSSGAISVKGGTLYFDSWKLKGVTTTCTFTDLFNAESAAHQKLYCKEAKNDSLKFSNMQLEFQLRGLKKLHVEGLSTGWFGGRLTNLRPFVLTNNISIPGKVNFLASKIILSPLLDYLGVKGLSSDALVGGVIPFEIKADKVFISDAALATQTSIRGFLRLDGDWSKYSGTDESEISRKKFTEAALKRFNYNWIRLNVTTTPQMSSIGLNIDGCPAKAVAFKYNAKKALFEPTSPGEPGINGDMTIETKFRIPKNKEVLK